METHVSGSMYIEQSDENAESLVGYIQLYPEMMATALRNSP